MSQPLDRLLLTCGIECGHRARKVGGSQTTGVPAEVSLHEVDALALDGFADDHRGPVAVGRRKGIDRCNELSHVVAVNHDNVPAKCRPLIGVWLEHDAFFIEAGHELAIAVDEGHHVAEFIASGGHRRLPYRTLAGLAIAEHAEDSVRLATT